MHLLIEYLLHRVIVLPNPIPFIRFNGKIALAFYYYLFNEKQKTLKLLVEIGVDGFCDKIPLKVTGFNSSIVFNDNILRTYMKNRPLIYLRSTFLRCYMITQVMSKRAIKNLIKMRESGGFIEDEINILNMLKVQQADENISFQAKKRKTTVN